MAVLHLVLQHLPLLTTTTTVIIMLIPSSSLFINFQVNRTHIPLTVSELTMQLRDSGFTLRGVNLMSVPTTTCCSHDTPLFKMSTLEICTGRHLVADCLSCHPTTGWWSTSSSGDDAPTDVSTHTTLPDNVTCLSKKPVGISRGDVNFLN